MAFYGAGACTGDSKSVVEAVDQPEDQTRTQPPAVGATRLALLSTAELLAVSDTYLKSGSPNKNQGDETLLRVRKSGKNRILLQFDQAAIEAAIAGEPVYEAHVELTITDNGGQWGSSGRSIGIHRVLAPWTELGATWNCGDDTDTGNGGDDCPTTSWDMDDSSQWPFWFAPTSTTLATNDTTGVFSFDVTEDVQDFVSGTEPNLGWVVRLINENETGRFDFASRETATAPKLAVTFGTPDDPEPPEACAPTPIERDTYVRKGSPNQNEGGLGLLRIKSSGQNRALIGLDAQSLVDAIQGQTLESANLTFHVGHNGGNWGAGGEVDLHRLLVPWGELTATWNCASDANVGNSSDDCGGVDAWDMDADDTSAPYDLSPTDTVFVTNETTETISFSITSDVQAILQGGPAYGWVVRKREEGQAGLIELVSREASVVTSGVILMCTDGEPTDTTPPTLAVSAPADGSLLSSSPITVTGVIDDDTASVTVNGVAAAVSGGAFTASNVPLVEGSNTLTAVATDPAGNSATSTIDVILDTTAPSIVIIEPFVSILSQSPITVSGTVDSDVTVVTVNGIAAAVNGGTFTVSNVPLTEGNNALIAIATDLAGNSTTVTVDVILDTIAPSIVITEPSDPVVIGSPITVAGTVDDDTASVTVNGVVAVMISGTFTVANVPVVEGTNTLTVVAIDPVGNSSTATIDVILDTGPPSIVITEPLASVVLETPITVSGTVDDNSAIVTVNGITAAVTGGTFAASAVPLVEGSNTLTVVATDSVGSSTTATVEVTLDTIAPSIAITIPLEKLVLATPILIAGTVDDDSAVVTVNGVATTVTSGTFEANGVSLVEGANTVTATAVDPAGNVGASTIEVDLLVLPPVVAVTQPANGATVEVDLVDVFGTIDDNDAVVDVNGVPAAVASGAFAAIDVPLVLGSNTVIVTATNTAGKIRTLTIELTRVEPAPVVTIASPANLTTFGATAVLVEGTVSDPAALVAVNGVAAPLDSATPPRFSVPLLLKEGANLITANATSPAGRVGSATISLLLDTKPPVVTIDSPADGLVTTDPAITVTGMINDIVTGTVNEAQAEVSVNGTPAAVANRNYLVGNIPLTLGTNLIVAEGQDAAGNVVTTSIQVTREAVVASPRVDLLSGNNQTGTVLSTVAEPLVVQLLDAGGQPVAGEMVVFRVQSGGGQLDDGTRTGAAIAVEADAQGRASGTWILGNRAGAGNQRVEARATGFGGVAVFAAIAQTASPSLIVVDSGNEQVGSTGQGLPRPLVAVVVDNGNNRVAGVSVTFDIHEGEGSFGGATSFTTQTDGDGRALAELTLGPDPGVDNNVVTATHEGNTGFPASFAASGRVAGDPAATSLSGVVLDNTDQPIEGVTVSIEGAGNAVQTDPQGQFVIAPAPIGTLSVEVDGSTATRPGVWPHLEYEVVTIAGVENTLPRPVYLVELDVGTCPAPNTESSVGPCIWVSEAVGGVLENSAFPGLSIPVGPGTVTFADGSRSGHLSVTAVHADKIPMTPGFGQQPRLVVTIQPAGAAFDPPAPFALPNVEDLVPGEVTELYSFDHDLGQFVAIGTGSVSADGSVLRSDPGVGIIKSGWHCGGNSAEGGCVHQCPKCEACDANCVCVIFDGDGRVEGCEKCVNGDLWEPTDDQCCMEPEVPQFYEESGKSGTIVCCDGKAVACSKEGLSENVDKCVLEHEDAHTDQHDCAPDDCFSHPGGASGGDECEAYQKADNCWICYLNNCASEKECIEAAQWFSASDSAANDAQDGCLPDNRPLICKPPQEP